jgi:RNA polymerase sigma factor (sigma-70 family)
MPKRTPTRYSPQLPEHQSWIRRQARRVLGPRVRSVMDSQDLAQETHLTALRDIGRCEFADERSFRAWIRVIMRNIAAKVGRRKGPLFGERESLSRIPGTGSTPSMGMRREDARGRWRHLASGLSKRDQKVVTLRLVEGLSFKDVGMRLGMEEGHARVAFNRSVKKLKA